MGAVLGYVAMALLWSAPAWLRWDGRVSFAFVVIALPAALFPGVGSVLPGLESSDPTHTVAFVAVVALVGGGVIAVLAESVLTRWWIEDEGRLPARTAVYAFAATGLLIGGLSHLFVDVLVVPPAGRPIEPFRPILADPVSLDHVRALSDPAWSATLLVVATTLHVGLFLVDRR